MQEYLNEEGVAWGLLHTNTRHEIHKSSRIEEFDGANWIPLSKGTAMHTYKAYRAPVHQPFKLLPTHFMGWYMKSTSGYIEQVISVSLSDNRVEGKSISFLIIDEPGNLFFSKEFKCLPQYWKTFTDVRNYYYRLHEETK